MRFRRAGLLLAAVSLAIAGGGPRAAFAAPTLDGITFVSSAGHLFVPARKAADALGWSVRWEPDSQALYLNGNVLPADIRQARLPDGTVIIALRGFEPLGAQVNWDPKSETATVSHETQSFTVKRGEKRVEIDRTNQTLRAWQGKTLVLETPVSTGRDGKRTPTGNFTAGPYKSRMHYSRLYNGAPMPYSVQVSGNIFIHGFSSVPEEPASHGCIRMPLGSGGDSSNPARWFFNWVTVGTPISITGRWEG